MVKQLSLSRAKRCKETSTQVGSPNLEVNVESEIDAVRDQVFPAGKRQLGLRVDADATEIQRVDRHVRFDARRGGCAAADGGWGGTGPVRGMRAGGHHIIRSNQNRRHGSALNKSRGTSRIDTMLE